MSPICISEESVSTRVGDPVHPVIGKASFNAVEETTFSKQITTEQLRLQKIKISRNSFAALGAALAVAGGVCFYLGVPYQPFVAAFIATSGIVTVLAMKAAGK